MQIGAFIGGAVVGVLGGVIGYNWLLKPEENEILKAERKLELLQDQYDQLLIKKEISETDSCKAIEELKGVIDQYKKLVEDLKQ